MSKAIQAAEAMRRNVMLQRAYYGEAMGDRLRRLMRAYQLTQTALAHTLGISPAMLSQVMSGRRQKIANPTVVARLTALERRARNPDVVAGDPVVLAAVLEQVRELSPAVIAAERLSAEGVDADGALISALAATCTGVQLWKSAAAVSPVSATLAQLLQRAATHRDSQGESAYPAP